MRIDCPHEGMMCDHINIDSRYFGFKSDHWLIAIGESQQIDPFLVFENLQLKRGKGFWLSFYGGSNTKETYGFLNGKTNLTN